MTILKHWCTFLSAVNKRSNLISAGFLLLLLCNGFVSYAQETLAILTPEIIQMNQNTQYQIGDRIQMSIALPFVSSQGIKSIKIRNPDEKNPLDSQGFYLDPSPQVINGNLRFSVSPIKSGKLTLPELQVIKDETTTIGKTSPVSITVAELNAPKDKEPELLDPVSISLPFKFIIYGLLILGLIILAFYSIYKRYLKKPKAVKTPVEVKIPPVPDHEIAIRDLNALYETYSYSGENLKPVAFGVSQILKNFFSARFKIDAKESTTDEMLALLRDESLSENEIRKLTLLFRDLDLIKFTDYIHHSRFQKSDYLNFKDSAKSIIDTWTIKGGLS